MDLRHIKELIELMERHRLVEIELDEEGRKIRLRKDAGPIVVAPQPAPKESLPQAQPVAEHVAPTPAGLREVRSPMVGTFYRAASPESDPYVEAGDTVKEGEVLCLIEAMKVMNEIKAEVAGAVEKILAENGQPVEYGEVLFLIRPE